MTVIGVVDSGVGGLSVLPALRRALPNERFVYVADSGHAPYGDKSADFLLKRAEAVLGFLLGQGAQAVVLACNTLSVAAAQNLRQRHPLLPLVAMEPAIKPAALGTRSGTVLVLATAGTVYSASVARLCEQYGQHARIVLQACPGWVECIERGQANTPAMRALIESHVRPGLDQGADTIVLGCTHYAFVAPILADLAGPAVQLIETSQAVARQLQRVYTGGALPACASEAQDAQEAHAPVAFYTSGQTVQLRAFLQQLGEGSDAVYPLPV